jgi:thiazole/oxazole-forming peptide maturase SagD family component
MFVAKALTYAPAKTGKVMPLICTGYGSTGAEAMAKAMIEAVERTAMDDLRTDRVAAAIELDKRWLDPRKVAPITKDQLRYFHPSLRSFSPKIPWQWVLGKHAVNGEEVYLAIDNVFWFHSRQVRRRRCTFCSSNGVAAHFDPDAAVRFATLELIERDAVMVLYYSRRQVFELPSAYIPRSIQNRIGQIRRRGYHVKLLDITLDSVPVVLAMIYSVEKTPHLIVGAAAAETRIDAIKKAFCEAECGSLSYKKSVARRWNITGMSTPEDHGWLYSDFRSSMRQIDWLLKSEKREPIKEARIDILQQFDVVTVRLKPKQEKGMPFVYRAISDRLLPIHFGYGAEYYTHPRLRNLGLARATSFPSFPHFFP